MFSYLEPILDAFCAIKPEMTSPVQSNDKSQPVLFSNFSSFSNTNGSVFTPSGIRCSPIPRLYWLHVGADIGFLQGVNTNFVSSRNSTSLVLLTTQNELNGTDRVTRDGIIQLEAGEQMNCFSNSSLNTFWSGFRLDSLMKPLIAFYVGRTTPWTTFNTAVMYDRIFFNVGNGWNSTSNRFIAPRNGTYYFSLSFGYKPGSSPNFQIFINVTSKLFSAIGVSSTMTTGIGIAAKSYMITMARYDRLEVRTGGGPLYSDANNFQMALVGFLYSPVEGSLVNSLYVDQIYIKLLINALTCCAANAISNLLACIKIKIKLWTFHKFYAHK